MNRGALLNVWSTSLFASALIFLSTSDAPAQDLCPNPAVSYVYEGNVSPDELPPDEVWQTAAVPHPPEYYWKAEGGLLKFYYYTVKTSAMFTREEELTKTASKFSFEARFHISRHQTQMDYGVMFGLADNMSPTYVHGYPNAGTVCFSPLSGDDICANADLTTPATYKVIVDKSDNDSSNWSITLLRDDNILLEVAYWDLNGHVLFVPNTSAVIANWGGIDSVWDYVKYEICIPHPEPPPIEEQIANVVEETSQSDLPWPVAKYVEQQMYKASRTEDDLEKGQIFYKTGEKIFKLAHAKVIQDYPDRLQNLLDFARNNVAPEITRHEGYMNKINVMSSLPKVTDIVPGVNRTYMRLFIDLLPKGNHAAGNNNKTFGIQGNIGVIELTTGEIFKTDTFFTELEVNNGGINELFPIDFTWDGYGDDGTPADPSKSYFIDAMVSYVELDQLGNVVDFLDSGATTMGGPGWPSVPSKYLANRYFGGLASPVTDIESPISLIGQWFIHTEDILPAWDMNGCDPIMHVIDDSGLFQFASSDDCPYNIGDWRDGYRKKCWDLTSGRQEIECPIDLRGSRNSCVRKSLDSIWPSRPRIVVHGLDNNGGGSGKIVFWKETNVNPLLRTVEYEKRVVLVDKLFYGTHVEFYNGWDEGDEMDLIIPSPEKSHRLWTAGPARSPVLYKMTSPTRINQRTFGNGMAGGARISELSYTEEGLVILSSGETDVGGVSLYVNDVSTAMERDGDGLGEDLESNIGTSPNDPDTDGDGILDGFEVLGVRVPESLRETYNEQALPTWGADPLHKDVFVETDYVSHDYHKPIYCSPPAWMQCKTDPVNWCVNNMCLCRDDNDCWQAGENGRAYSDKCVQVGLVAYCARYSEPIHPTSAGFAQDIANKCSGAPDYLNNPDQVDGFSVHFDNGVDDHSTSSHGDWGGVNEVPPGPEDDICKNYKSGYYDHMSDIRRGIFRYALGCVLGGNSSGLRLTFNPTNEKDAGKIMIHELGHTFGLLDIGRPEDWSNYNYKPHYISIMNYLYQWKTPNYVTGSDSDDDNVRYSHGERRYILDRYGNRTGQVFELDPSDIDEDNDMLPDYVPSSASEFSNPYFDLQHYHSWYVVSPVILPEFPFLWFKVDWDRSGAIDTISKVDILTKQSTWFKHSFIEGELKHGPQLVEHLNKLYAFHVLKNDQGLTYRVYTEGPDCNPEYVGVRGEEQTDNHWVPLCGSWGSLYDVDVGQNVNVDSELSAVSMEVDGYSWPWLFLFFVNNERQLCVVSMNSTNGQYNWGGPYCDSFGYTDLFHGPPSAVVWNGKIMIYTIGSMDASTRTSGTYVVVMDPLNWNDPSQWQLKVPMHSQWLKSKTTPSVAVDPSTGDPKMIGVYTDGDGIMHLFEGVSQGSGWTVPVTLLTDDHWLDRPRGSTGSFSLKSTDSRPAFVIDRSSPSGVEKWTLWYHQPNDTYGRMTSSIEDLSHLGYPDPMTVFSIWSDTTRGEYKSSNKRNASLAFYKGKLRAAVVYEQHPDPAKRIYAPDEPGYLFMPIGDGIFEAKLRDFDDVGFIGQHLAASQDYLFAGMNGNHRLDIIEANHINLFPFISSIESKRDPEVMDSIWSQHDGQHEPPRE